MAAITKKDLAEKYGVTSETIRKRLGLFGFDSGQKYYDEQEIEEIFYPGMTLIEDGQKEEEVARWAAELRAQRGIHDNRDSKISLLVEDIVADAVSQDTEAIARGVAKGIVNVMRREDFGQSVYEELYGAASARAIERTLKDERALPGEAVDVESKQENEGGQDAV